MTTFKIHIHSVVNLITNSSTEIYTWADEDSVNGARTIFGDMIKGLGLSGTVDDYFTIELIGSSLEVRLKSDPKRNIADAVFNLFGVEAEYDG